MKDLVVNHYAVLNSSRGVRHYYAEIESRIRQDFNIDYYNGCRFLGRGHELIYSSNKDKVFWSPTHRGSLFASNQVITVHDVINIEFRYNGDWRKGMYKDVAARFYENSIKIVAISESTRRKLLDIFNINEKKVSVIKSGFFPILSTAHTDLEFLPTELRNKRFILFVTNHLVHKNNNRGLKAICHSHVKREGIILVIVGSLTAESISFLNSTQLHYVRMSYVSNDVFSALLNFAYFVFSPSLMEGHNLTVAQAMSCQTPVLCSNIEVHIEFFSDYPFYFDPSEVDSITHCINSFISSGIEKMADFHCDEVNRTFDHVADEYKLLFDSI